MKNRFITLVHWFGRWFSDQVYNCPENDLDSLLWIVFKFHAFLLSREAKSIGYSMDYCWIGERLCDLWRYYWSFQTQEYKTKAREAILAVTLQYKTSENHERRR